MKKLTTPTTVYEDKQYFYLSDHLGSSSWITDKDGNALQHLSYLPFGEVFANQKASGSSFDAEFKFLGKELDSETGYTKTDNRYYWANAGIFLSVDPMASERSWVSPYSYCQNSPVMRVDPTGALDNPIYDLEGNFLGTDERGLQGDAIIMSKSDFDRLGQGMSHDDAISAGYTLDNMSNEQALEFANNGNFENFLDHYNSLSSRPDWDGYLTLDEANDWYRNGNGQALYTDLSKIDLSNLYSKGEKYVNEVKVINLFRASNSTNDALVYGQITLKRYPNHQVRAYSDEYNFETHNPWNPLNWPRNIQTRIGRYYAGEGQKYDININGSKTLKPMYPWTK